MIFDALLAHVARAVHHGGLRVFGHGWDHFRHPAVEFTPSRDGDSPFVGTTVHRTVSLSSSLPERLDQVPDDEEIGTVTGDDTRRGPTALVERRATALVGRSVHWKARGSSSLPIRKNGRPWKDDGPAALDIVLGPMADNVSPRNAALRATRHFGRALWKRWTGGHARSPAEAKMPSPVRSNRWRSNGSAQGLRRTHHGVRHCLSDQWLTPDRPAAEIHIRAALMNRVNALGTAKIVRVA